jgi:hypothetical protein
LLVQTNKLFVQSGSSKKSLNSNDTTNRKRRKSD